MKNAKDAFAKTELLVREMLASGRLNEAETKLQQWMKCSPVNARAFELFADLSELRDDIEEACRALIAVLRAKENSPAWGRLAHLFYKRGMSLEARICVSMRPPWLKKKEARDAYENVQKKFENTVTEILGKNPGQFLPLSDLVWPLEGMRRFLGEDATLGRMGQLIGSGEYDAALAVGYKLLQNEPKSLNALINVAVVHRRRRNFGLARKCLYYVIWMSPSNSAAIVNLGNWMCDVGATRTAVDLLDLATVLNPSDPNAWGNLAVACNATTTRNEDAINAAYKSLELRPKNPSVLNNLANSLKAAGRLNDALRVYQDVIDLRPDDREAYHNYLLALQYADGYAADEVARKHIDFGLRFEEQYKSKWGDYANEWNLGKTLRVGFMSPDLRDHAVAYFVEPLWAHLSKFGIQIFAYNLMLAGDVVTQRLKNYCYAWRSAAQMDDDALAAQIREDQIDILVDLTGHTGRNRLLVFARKPAPVQVTWLGHPNTTGLTAIDWRLTDALGDPEGVDSRYSEKLFRLPDVFCCYRPLIKKPQLRGEKEYAVRSAPALNNGYITFGCCNNLAKVTPPVVQLWCRILHAVPSSKLLIEAPGLQRVSLQEEWKQKFAQHGIDAKRLQLVGRDTANQYLTYHQIDIALDPFPCNGGTTTCDVLWMGVPLITLAGDGFMARMGATLVSAAGYPEWVVKTPEAYLSKAVELASDMQRLQSIRSAMRGQVEASPLMNEPLFAKHVADAFHEMWKIAVDGATGRSGGLARFSNAVAAAKHSFDVGKHEEAKFLYYEIYKQRPDLVEVTGSLGMLAWRESNFKAAIVFFLKALENSIITEYLYCLGLCYKRIGSIFGARACVAHAVKLRTKDVPENWNCELGNLNAQAESSYTSDFNEASSASLVSPIGSIELNGEVLNFDQLSDLIEELSKGDILTNNLEDATVAGLRMCPGRVAWRVNLGVIYMHKRRWEDAKKQYLLAILLDPTNVLALGGYADFLCHIGMAAAAIPLAQTVTVLSPDFFLGWSVLGRAIQETGSNLEAAEKALRKAISIKSTDFGIYNNLAIVLKRMGRSGEATSLFKQIISQKPDQLHVWNNYLLALQYADGFSAEAVAQEHLGFGRQFEGKLTKFWGNYSNLVDPEKDLRIGFMSPDLRDHAVAYFVEPLWAHLSKFGIQIFAYNLMLAGDVVTQRLKNYCYAWRSAAQMDDDALAAQIREDQIDILVDLTGHTGRNRLLVFARKPAPVQVTWLGHPNTTGLTAIDWRLTDALGDPEGVDSRYSEKLFRLPDVFCCYRPLIKKPQLRGEKEYAVRSAPALNNGYITFGCCNNLAKVTPPVVQLWCRILHAVPSSKLLIEAPGLQRVSLQEEWTQKFAQHGIDAKRLQLVGRDTANQYLTYHKIDIALDPFPCNGGTTTCDVLWMGVPLITLAGDGFMARMGATLVSAAGYPEWVVKTPEAYLSKAVELASDMQRLQSIRSAMRGQVEASPLMNEPLFASNVAGAFRYMWKNWCASNGALRYDLDSTSEI